MVKPGSYMWKYHRPPPRRPPARRSNFVDMDSILDVFEHLIRDDELDLYDVDFDTDIDVRMSWDLELDLLLSQLDLESSDMSDNDNYSF